MPQDERRTLIHAYAPTREGGMAAFDRGEESKRRLLTKHARRGKFPVTRKGSRPLCEEVRCLGGTGATPRLAVP
jgi:hypothetical protein